MTGEIDTIDGDFFYANKIIFKICSLWIPGRNIPKLPRILYLTYFLCFYSIGLCFTYCELVIFGDMLTEISKFVSYFGMLFTHVVGFLKFLIMVLQRKRINRMMNTLQDAKYSYRSFGDFQPEKLFHRSKITTFIFSSLIFILYTFVGASAHISAHFSMSQAVKNRTLGENVTCMDFVPYYFYLPFTATTKAQCEYIFVLMNICYAIYAWLIACHDCLFAALLNCLRTQLIIVSGAFRTIRQRCLEKLDLPVDCILLHDEENSEVEKSLYEELTHCIEHLNVLLQLVIRDDIEYCFSYVTLAQSLASLFILASCLYISSTVPITSPEFFSQIEYFACILAQLSLICWFGNEIALTSDHITLSLYEAEWYSASPRFKRSMIITICRMQRPLYLSIGKFSPLTLETLVAVCRGSFSYFAVLKSIQ